MLVFLLRIIIPLKFSPDLEDASASTSVLIVFKMFFFPEVSIFYIIVMNLLIINCFKCYLLGSGLMRDRCVQTGRSSMVFMLLLQLDSRLVVGESNSHQVTQPNQLMLYISLIVILVSGAVKWNSWLISMFFDTYYSFLHGHVNLGHVSPLISEYPPRATCSHRFQVSEDHQGSSAKLCTFFRLRWDRVC